MSIRVLRPGLHTTVQDLGRYGLQHLGVVPCGAMDVVAHRLANALVGNEAGAATLECTVVGPELLFEDMSLVALCGAAFEATVGGEPLPQHRPVLLTPGTRLRVGSAVRGARGYLAVAGGISVPAVLGSRSTYVPAAYGGFSGRALRAGDALDAGAPALAQTRFGRLKNTRSTGNFGSTGWRVEAITLPPANIVAVRAMEGRHYGQFDAGSRRAFFDETWQVSKDSNRMGFRLAGPALARRSAGELLSEPTCLGSVQAPADGSVIVLMADHQTTGGYPKIAEVAGADVALLSQVAPGGALRFVRCTVGEAREALQRLHEKIAGMTRGIELQYGG
ncbi:MAG: biotin-dependent carboxyltransferase family protein [Burkholderiales bacterium]|nr:biotin-dependent carboxyltransferase family protein [Burkholderiales bacterium]